MRAGTRGRWRRSPGCPVGPGGRGLGDLWDLVRVRPGSRRACFGSIRTAQKSMNSMSIELALTTGMRRGEVCALRWSDFDDAGAMTVSHALGNGPGGFYLKEPKTGSFARYPPHQPHDDAQGHAGRHAPCYGRDGYGRGRPLHPGHSGAGQPSLQPHAARQGLLRLLQDGRLFLHVPRPAPHVRHHDDRGRLRRTHGGEPPSDTRACR